MSTEAKFVDGMRVYAPRENAPDFVIADVVIEHDDFVDWLADRGDKVRITIKRSRGGKLYASENDYKPSSEAPKPSCAPAERPQQETAGGGFADDDIPFAPLGKHCHWIA
jgi:hypothetical protein